ncbi:hypothetical protein ISCGN_026120 [Ixodes scapularis]
MAEMHLEKRMRPRDAPDTCAEPDAAEVEAPDQLHQDDVPVTVMQLISTTEASDFDTFLHELKDTYHENAIATIESLTREQSSCPAWLQYRRGVATSTCCHSFKTRAKSLSTEERPHNVCGLVKAVLKQKTFQSADMKRGLRDEPTAAKKYVEVQQKRGHIVTLRTSGLVFWSKLPVMACSPDRIVTFKCSCCEGKIAVLEIKCPRKLQNSLKCPKKLQNRHPKATMKPLKCPEELENSVSKATPRPLKCLEELENSLSKATGLQPLKCPEELQNSLSKATMKPLKCPEELQNSLSKATAKPLFYTQVQVQMGILGIGHCDFFVYESSTVWKLLPISFNKDYFDECVQSITQMYREYIFTALRSA